MMSGVRHTTANTAGVVQQTTTIFYMADRAHAVTETVNAPSSTVTQFGPPATETVAVSNVGKMFCMTCSGIYYK